MIRGPLVSRSVAVAVLATLSACSEHSESLPDAADRPPPGDHGDDADAQTDDPDADYLRAVRVFDLLAAPQADLDTLGYWEAVVIGAPRTTPPGQTVVTIRSTRAFADALQPYGFTVLEHDPDRAPFRSTTLAPPPDEVFFPCGSPPVDSELFPPYDAHSGAYLDGMEQEMLAMDNGGSIRTESIGTTHEGREILAVRVGPIEWDVTDQTPIVYVTERRGPARRRCDARRGLGIPGVGTRSLPPELPSCRGVATDVVRWPARGTPGDPPAVQRRENTARSQRPGTRMSSAVQWPAVTPRRATFRGPPRIATPSPWCASSGLRSASGSRNARAHCRDSCGTSSKRSSPAETSSTASWWRSAAAAATACGSRSPARAAASAPRAWAGAWPRPRRSWSSTACLMCRGGSGCAASRARWRSGWATTGRCSGGCVSGLPSG